MQRFSYCGGKRGGSRREEGTCLHDHIILRDRQQCECTAYKLISKLKRFYFQIRHQIDRTITVVNDLKQRIADILDLNDPLELVDITQKAMSLFECIIIMMCHFLV